MKRQRPNAQTASFKPVTLKSTMPKLTDKGINDLLVCCGYTIEKSGRAWCVYFNKKWISTEETLFVACQFIKKHSRDRSIGATVAMQFNHFIDTDDYSYDPEC